MNQKSSKIASGYPVHLNFQTIPFPISITMRMCTQKVIPGNGAIKTSEIGTERERETGRGREIEIERGISIN